MMLMSYMKHYVTRSKIRMRCDDEMTLELAYFLLKLGVIEQVVDARHIPGEWW